MAKRKSLTTETLEDEPSSKPQSKPSKKVKTEQLELDAIDESESESKAKQPSKNAATKNEETEDADVQSSADGEKYIDLGKNKRATVRSFKGTTLIDIREFYADKASGELKPGKKGISLTSDQWQELNRVAPTIDRLITEVNK